MFVDMHLHEKTFSSDSRQSLDEMIYTAKKRGLDAICITDHDSMGMFPNMKELSEKYDFPIFVGVEYFSLDGDITAFGIDSIPEERISAQDFIDYVRSKGGVCFACHPFRNNNRGLREKLSQVSGLTGIEVFNGSTPYEDNRQAYDYCDELNLLPIGASDAHHTKQLGKYATWLPGYVEDLDGFVGLIKRGISKPAMFNGSEYITYSYDDYLSLDQKVINL